jgi:hypothetical protein
MKQETDVEGMVEILAKSGAFEEPGGDITMSP